MFHRPIIKQRVRQNQKLIINLAMERAFRVLKMPIYELSHFVEAEIEQNPLLEILPEASFQNKDFVECQSFIPHEPTFYEHTIKEVRLHFDEPREIEIATYIAGCLDEKGFFTLNEEEVSASQGVSITYFQSILKKFHNIEPLGLGTRNVREAVLIQLKALKKDNALIYKIFDKHFHYLKQGQVKELAKKLHLPLEKVTSTLKTALKGIQLFPGSSFLKTPSPPIIPDLFIKKEDEHWEIDTNDALLPSFRVHSLYLKALGEKDPFNGDIKFIREQLASGKWLKRILRKRKKTLQDIGIQLLKKQESFLEGVSSAPLPMTMQEIASALSLSTSTITRAIEGKYLSCPSGLIKLRDFFTGGLQTKKGIISNKQAKNLLLTLIAQEDKSIPLSDKKLSEKMLKQGILCARRTISKYRKELNIHAARERQSR